MSQVKNNILYRVYILLGIFLFVGGIIVLRMMGLQLNQEKWMQKELEEKVEFKRVIADRGSILAEDGTPLAVSLPFYRIAIDPSMVDTTTIEHFRDSLYMLASNLATHYGVLKTDTLLNIVQDSLEGPDTTYTYYHYKDTMAYYHRMLDAIRTKDRHLYLTRKALNFKELRVVREWPLLGRSRFKGGLLAEKIHNKRYYPFGELASITLGRLAGDTVGAKGIEYAFNRELRGRDGYMLVQKVAGKSYIPIDEYGEEGSEDGYDVVTTLDVDLQDIVWNALRRGCQQQYAKAGTAILIEVNTGEIKALANYPETYNYGVATRIEPGSTFKLASAAVILEEGVKDLCDTVNTYDGVVTYDDKEVTDDGVAYGIIPFETVFAKSSNVGMSKIVNDAFIDTPQVYLQYLEKFGLKEPVLDDLAGEPRPVIYKPGDEMWNAVATLPNMAYGYGLELTPLQIATFYNTVANAGYRIEPWLIKEVRNNSKILQHFETQTSKTPVISGETVEKLHVLMERVVNDGTASRMFKGMPFQVAGKTGTARKTKNGRYVRQYRASFGGFFPSNNPRYTCYVMIDEPNARAISGGKVAAPIFREIAEKTYKMDLNLAKPKKDTDARPDPHPNLRMVNAQTAETVLDNLGLATSELPQSEWVEASSNGHQINLKPYEINQTVPNLRGMSARDAIHLLEKMGLTVQIRGTGKVRRQSLLPGYRVGDNQTITLFLG